MAKKPDRAAALLSLIQNSSTHSQAGTDSMPRDVPEAAPLPSTPSGTASKALRNTATGKRTQVFLHDADRRIIRELVAYFAGQGKRVSESLIIKAALRTAKPGDSLLRAYEEAAAQDQRFKT